VNLADVAPPPPSPGGGDVGTIIAIVIFGLVLLAGIIALVIAVRSRGR
jgi:hypothetical protein